MGNELPPLGADFEIWGHWWLPSHPSDQVAGRLSCRGGSLELQLLGKFDAIDVNLLHATVPVIHGVGGTKTFTLWNAVQLQFGLRLPGTIEQHFGHMRILEGQLLPDRSEVRFSGFAIHATNIGPWSGQRPIDQSLTTLEDGQIEVDFRFAGVKSEKLELPEHGMTLAMGSSVGTRVSEFRSYGFEVTPYIQVKFDSAQLFDDVIDRAGSVMRMLSLLIGSELISNGMTVELEGATEPERPLSVRFEYPPPDDDEKTMDVHEVLVPFREVHKCATEIVSTWFREEQRIKDAADLLLGTTRRRRLQTPIELTTLAQALETFHRNVHGGNYMSVQDYEPIRDAISAVIQAELDDSHKAALRSRIKYGYQFSFHKRLRQLLAQFDDATLSALGIEAGSFADATRDARNYFTHWDAEAGKPKVTGAELTNLASKLKAFTRLVLLTHLGVPADVVVRRILQSKYLYLPKSVPLAWS